MTPRILLLTAATLLVLVGVGVHIGMSHRAEAKPPAPPRPTDSDAQLRDQRVQRGAYLVNTSGCHDCHTPFKEGPKGAEPDMTRMLSGHPQQLVVPPAPPPAGPWVVSVLGTNTAWAGPWGTSFTANLTPDRETGTGKWTEQNFVRTIRTGRHLGSGRELLPPMPVPVYANFSDEDLKSIYWYLQSLPPIRNRVPQPLPPPGA